MSQYQAGGGREGDSLLRSVLPGAADRWKLKRSEEEAVAEVQQGAALDGGQSQLSLTAAQNQEEAKGWHSTPPALKRPCPKPLPGVGQRES